MGLKIYGSPWQPDFSQSAFCLQRGDQLRNKWERPSHTLIYFIIVLRYQFVSLQRWLNIPEDVQVLVTHAPPLGVGDLCNGWGGRAGDRKWKLQNTRDFHFFLMRENMAWGDEQVTDRDFHYLLRESMKGFFCHIFQSLSLRIWLRIIVFLAGCEDLLKRVTKVVQPKLHIFGHIHEGGQFWNYKIASSLLNGFSLHGTVPQSHGVICWLSNSYFSRYIYQTKIKVYFW